MLLRYPDVPLEEGHVRVRPWRLDDLGCVEAAATDPHIPLGTSVPPVFTPAEGTAFLERQLGRLTHGEGVSQAIADRTSDEAVGLIILSRRPQDWVAGLGYWLVPAARGQHYASTAIRLVTASALAELDVARVEAWVAPDNEPSQRVLERSGFVLEGRLRNYLRLAGETSDALVFSRVGPQSLST